MKKTEELQPLMRQYREIKNKYPNAFLLFRLGDFYEMFEEDARQASPLLGLVLTARNGLPMCGVPYHSHSKYVSRLLLAGKNVAICEQMENPSEVKGRIVKREVVRVITPGTIIEDELLNSPLSKYLVSVEIGPLGWGLSSLDVSTGEFWTCQRNGDGALAGLSAALARINPSEIVCSQDAADELKTKPACDKAVFSIFEPSGKVFSWDRKDWMKNFPLAHSAALRAGEYASANNTRITDRLIPEYRSSEAFLELDRNAARTLEIIASTDGDRSRSLWAVLNKTKTAMGARKLREWISHPLLSAGEINERLNAVELLVENARGRAELADILKDMPDIERAYSRLSSLYGSPRDAFAVTKSLLVLDALKNYFAQSPYKTAEKELLNIYEKLHSLCSLLLAALNENPPAKAADGDIIKDGYSAELDELRGLQTSSKTTLSALEEREREKTAIPSLKVGYNSIFGYYIEITKLHLSKVPYNYIRRQTLINCERFITEELKELEDRILGARDKTLKLETQLFADIAQKISACGAEIKTFARIISKLDALLSFAVCAIDYNYCKPSVNNGKSLTIKNGRHPIVEQFIPPGDFMPNDLFISDRDPQIIILTGPNMSGKSVYLRQIALIVLMAQAGSFVPADAAELGITDKIMTRIGAHDVLSRGESTFMVEMRETAAILSQSTDRSLLLLDEIGRGTSTFDGISIAWAVIEKLHNASGGPKTLFATHYFELTELEQKLAGVKNFNVGIKEVVLPSGKTDIVFLHKVSPGSADKSYGIHVAELAGIDISCILRAKQVLSELEEKSVKSEPKQIQMFAGHPIIDDLSHLNPESLTPIEALKLLIEWKKRLK